MQWFHLQIKATIKCYDHVNNWFDIVPIVLLWIRTALKEYIDLSAVEMVYGKIIQVPVSSSTSQKYFDIPNFIISLLKNYNRFVFVHSTKFSYPTWPMYLLQTILLKSLFKIHTMELTTWLKENKKIINRLFRHTS